jgi:long-chain fatty acid transport protein
MRKKISLLIATMAVSASAWAGGLLHNTNQHIAFLRMMARGASHEIDAVYTNPAGLAWLDNEGWTVSLNIQSAFQTRDVETTFPLFAYTNADGNPTRKYDGKATAPVLPSLYAAYKKDRWVASAFFGVTGGGGKCNFDNGLSMFDAAVMSGIYGTTSQLLASQPLLKAMVGADAITPDMYTIDTSMKGRQYVFGGQLGGTYRILDNLSAFAGLRFNLFNGNYKGHLNANLGDALKQRAAAALATLPPEQAAAYAPMLAALGQEGGLTHIALDTDQKGWGLTPIIGVNFKWRGLTLAAKYEFKTNLHIENDTKTLEATAMGEASEQFETAMAPYKHGVNTPNDLPSVLYVAAGYEFIPNKLRGTVEYHFYDDKHAEMANDKQKSLRHGTHEILAGVEWDINRTFTVSAGFQNTDYGLSDDYQTHTAFSCDSYSIGFGGAINVTPKMKVNVGYFWTNYKDYKRSQEHYLNNAAMPAGSDKFSRSNKVFGVGVDYKF